MTNNPKALPHVPPHRTICFMVFAINEAVEKITANGGPILNGPMQVPGGDRIVNAMDSRGAACLLHACERS